MKIKQWLQFLCIFIFLAASGQTLAVPVIYNIVLDASESVTREGFNLEKRAAISLAETCYENAEENPGQRADWLSVNFFGGATHSSDYMGTKFVNCSNRTDIALLELSLLAIDHPRFGYTAIYDAISNGTSLAILKELSLPGSGSYLKVVFLVTDGQDNDSSTNAKRDVDNLFPNKEKWGLHFAVPSTTYSRSLFAHDCLVGFRGSNHNLLE